MSNKTTKKAASCGAKRKREDNHYTGDDCSPRAPTSTHDAADQEDDHSQSFSGSHSVGSHSSRSSSSCDISSNTSSVNTTSSENRDSCADSCSADDDQSSCQQEEEEEFDELGEAFVEAAEDGDFSTVEEMIEKGTPSNIDYHDESGSTALHKACENAHHDVVQLLLKHGANANEPSPCETYETAIMYAAKGGHYDTFMRLVENGAEIDIESDAGWTPLILAAEGGNLGIVRYLADNGADITATVNNPYEGTTDSVVNCAAKGNNVEVLEFLVNEKGASVHAIDDENEPLSSAIVAKQFRNAAFLLEKGANANACWEDCGTCFDQAVWTGDRNLQLLLLHYGADIDNDGAPGDTALVSVAERDEAPGRDDDDELDDVTANDEGLVGVKGLEDLSFLLEHGATINMARREDEDAKTPLLAAAMNEHYVRVALLLQAGCAFNVL